MPEAFDVIQSRFGLVHASNHALALENLLNSLKPGGVLLIRGIEYGGSLRVFGKVPIEKLHEHARLLAGGADLDALEEIEHEHPELEWLRVAETLERQGFIAPGLIGKTRFSVVPIRFRIERLGIRKADLSEFYGHPNNRVPIRRASSRA
ncbi:hypothetical protein AUJ14_01575 [Candidatus Micrarchaeota archaeon CG1_02_55_22]|nr:MAG: hypothetical protein AUJ14_01575 [Candidatus Micrarchaeota archaeon CG1_02_55_22]